MNKMRILWNRFQRDSLFLWPCEGTGKRGPSMNKETGPHQISNLPAPWFSQSPELWELRFFFISHSIYCYSITEGRTDWENKWHQEMGSCGNKYLNIWKCLWNQVIYRGWKSFGLHARKNLHNCECTIKDDSSESPERKRRARENFSIFSENT